jgi:hypothetical protein
MVLEERRGPMTGTRVSIEFVVQDHNPKRAAQVVERALRGYIERAMKRRLRHVVGSPKIRTEEAWENG